MTLFDRVKKLSDDQGKSLKTVALDLGFGENSLYGWKKKNPGIDKLKAVADYFHVSTDFLLGRTDNATLNDNDKEKKVDLSNDDYIMTYEGKPIPEEDMEYIKRILNGGKD